MNVAHDADVTNDCQQDCQEFGVAIQNMICVVYVEEIIQAG